MYSSAITIRKHNKKTPVQNDEKRDKCGENGECDERGGQVRTRLLRRQVRRRMRREGRGRNRKLVDF